MDLFSQIESLIPTLDGWCSVQRAQLLAASVLALRPANCTVVGVWGGRDVFAMALACKQIGTGMVHGIDPWSAAASKEGQDDDNLRWWAAADHEAIYQKFMKDVHALAVQNVVRVHRMTSDDYKVTGKIQVLVLDGNHGPQAVKDAERFAPQVSVGGLCMLDDLTWPGGFVLQAASKLKASFNLLYKVDNSEMYQRVV